MNLCRTQTFQPRYKMPNTDVLVVPLPRVFLNKVIKYYYNKGYAMSRNYQNQKGNKNGKIRKNRNRNWCI